MIVARITNAAGRVFNVRLVRRGDRYGLKDCLVHKEEEPSIEFWDATYENDPRFTIGRGQFVARYFLGTLTGKDSFYGHDHRRSTHGLDLCGHEPAWKITGPNVAEAIAACERELGKAEAPPPTRRVLTEEQLKALRVFADANGRDWKADLNHCWSEGCYRKYNGTDDEGSLQQVRNIFGPSWLVRFSFNNTATHSRVIP